MMRLFQPVSMCRMISRISIEPSLSRPIPFIIRLRGLKMIYRWNTSGVMSMISAQQPCLIEAIPLASFPAKCRIISLYGRNFAHKVMIFMPSQVQVIK